MNGVKFKAIIYWNKQAQKWFMKRARDGKFIYDFFDCENFSQAFQGVDKEKDTYFDILVKKVGE